MSAMQTEDQRKAFDFLNAFLANPALKEAVLKGYAGVGKTWLAGYWLESVLQDESSENVCIAAPTHKALDVLRQKCGHLNVTFKTLHSLLGVMVRKTDEGDSETDRFDPDLSFTLVVVDEASMVNKEFREILASTIKSGKIGKVLYIGDPAQLPPVKEDISPVFLLEHEFTMKEVVRYDGKIIKVATMLRERIADGDTFTLPDLIEAAGDDISDRSVSVINRDALYKWAQTAIAKQLDCRIVAWTNASVLTHNERMHRLCFPDAPFFGVGERCIANDSYVLRAPARGERQSEQDALYNGELLTVNECAVLDPLGAPVETRDVWQAIFERGVLLYNVRATRDTGQEISVVVPFSEERRAFVHKQLNDEIYQMGRNGSRADPKYQFLVKVRKQINRLCPLRHSYACTIHKSQGSTYDVCIVDFGDVYRSEDRARLMYVGFTRPSKFLVLSK
jgi:exodeoxyribonuclease-5